MQLKGINSMFNLFDTNGRRNDIINAYCSYIDIISNLNISSQNPWQSWPKSLVQYNFYEQALNKSKNVFKQHRNYDAVKEILRNDRYLNENFFNLNSQIKSNEKYDTFFKYIDNDVEGRARHYTSNLVKMGFLTSKREITKVGELLLNPNNLQKDSLEKILPIDNINIIILRQFSRLLIFDERGSKYYWPFGLALYIILTNKGEIAQNIIEDLVQVISPNLKYEATNGAELLNYFDSKGIESFIRKFGDNANIPDEIDNQKKLDKATFFSIFKNRKTSEHINTYFNFYNILYEYVYDNRNQEKLDNLLSFLSEKNNESVINKAFSKGKVLFNTRSTKSSHVEYFLSENSDNYLLKQENFNSRFYSSFFYSKQLDSLKENKNNIGRLLLATGIFNKENGIYKFPFWKLFYSNRILNFLNQNIFGCKDKAYRTYEEDEAGALFHKNQSIMDILNISESELEIILNNICKDENITDISELTIVLENDRNDKFKAFIDNKFPKEKTFEILSLFQDRKNDSKIKNKVTQDADIPTIFEYIVGLAWYHISDDKEYDLFNSFNLTMDGNYLPLTHAGGGQGDIEIDYKNRKLLIEVTLMNEAAQRRSEWEPVLRHSVNLACSEPHKEVLTLFIANTLDLNTINIWRAVASVPLRETYSNQNTTNKVIIMPLKISELVKFGSTKHFSSEKLIQNINSSFQSLSRDFDDNWRIKIIN